MNKKGSSSAKTVVLVDDHPLLRQGLAALINQSDGLKVAGEADDAGAGLKLIEQLQPDAVVVDISLPDGSGIELIKDVHIRAPHSAVLVLSMHDEAVYAERVLKAGARGYVSKHENPAKVIDGLRQILDGNVFLSEQLSARILQKLVGPSGAESTFAVDRLSDREFEVLELIGQGLPNLEIAAKLHLSVKTIDAHRENIKRKLDLPDAAALRKYAINWAQGNRGT